MSEIPKLIARSAAGAMLIAGAAAGCRGSEAVRYLDPLFAHVAVRDGVVFVTRPDASGIDRELKLDVYSPVDDAERSRPAVLWLHGGGFKPGTDRKQKYIVALATEFARRGYVCIAADYRVRKDPDADRASTLADALEDVRAVLDWIVHWSAKEGIDPSRLVLGGGSAGGKLAVNLAAAESGAPALIALIDLWGSPEPEWRPAAVGTRFPPTLIIHGTRDATVPFAMSEWLAGELGSRKVECVLKPLPGAPHTPVDRLPEILSTAVGFLYPRVKR